MTETYNKQQQTNRERELILAFARLDEWFDKSDILLTFKVNAGITDARQILTETVAVNKHLLKGLVRSLNAEITNSLTVETECSSEDQLSCCRYARPMDGYQREASEEWLHLRYQLRSQLSTGLQHLEEVNRHDALNAEDDSNVHELLNLLIHHVQRQLLHLETIQEAFCYQSVSLKMRTLRTLYRPVGERELELIIASGMRSFPPRLSWQPVFYPVLSLAFASEMAERWNMGEPDSDGAGFVMAFDIPEEYFHQYELSSGGNRCEELLVPSGQLDDFNAHIADGIRLERAFMGHKFDPSENVQMLLINKLMSTVVD